MISLIDYIIDNILNYDLKSLAENYIKLIDELFQSINILEYKKKQELNNYLVQLDASYRNKDYIFICDILEYKIKPLFIYN